MHIQLVGPGALGCLFSYFLAKGLSAGDSLTILDHNSERARDLAKGALQYENNGNVQKIRVTASSRPTGQSPADILLICVKSYDVTGCLEFCKPLLRQETLVVFLQNGISHLAVHAMVGQACCAYGTTTEGATLLAPGRVRHAGSGTTFLGFDSPVEARFWRLLTGLQQILAKGGLHVEQTDTILSRLWSKLMINVGINGLTAIYSCKNGQLLENDERLQRLEKGVREAWAVARAMEIPVQEDPVAAAKLVCEKTASNVSSMLQDVRNSKRTEIEAINGAIISHGRRLGIPTPENLRIYEQVKTLEAAYLHSFTPVP